MKKIAILTCLDALGSVCTGAGCMSAFNKKTGSFTRYTDDLELVAFFQCNGCDSDVMTDKGMEEKLERIIKINPDAVHVGVCTMKRDESCGDSTRCGSITTVIEQLQAHGIEIVDKTH